MICQGEVYWVDSDAPAGSAPGFRRPYVVIQNDVFNEARIRTTIVCALTSNVRLADAPGNVLLAEGEANLPKASVVNVSQIMTVDKMALVERIGSLSSRRLAALLEGVWGVLEPRSVDVSGR